VEGEAVMLSLEMLPAERGDSLLLEYGPGEAAEHRILIDGGHQNGYREVRQRLLEIAPDRQGRRRFELLVVTHIDADHIDGVIALLQDPTLNCWFGDVWFNGWRQLRPFTEDASVPDPTVLGPKQGEFLGGLLTALGQPWNRAFAGGPIFVPDDGPLPRVTLPGGIELTLVSPTSATLRRLRDEWEGAITAAHPGFTPGMGVEALRTFGRMLADDSVVTLGDESRRSTLDHSEANGSSVAFLVEFQGHRLLLSGDAFPEVLRVSLDRWRHDQPDRPPRVRLDAFKLAHHGSSRNITPQLLAAMSCRHYLISTNGAGRAKHPDVETIAAIRDGHDPGLGERPDVRFNYDTDQTALFRDVTGLATHYGEEATLRWST
jgi:hypothetical protein